MGPRTMFPVWCVSLLLLAGCAFTNPDNTPLLRNTEEALNLDENRTARILMMPLALPLGLVDVFVAHPVQVLDDAYEDTQDTFWNEPTGGTATRSYTFLPRAVFTPVVYVACFLGRSMFDIPPHERTLDEEELRLSEEQLRQERIEELEQDLEYARRRLDHAQEEVQELVHELEELRAEMREP